MGRKVWAVALNAGTGAAVLAAIALLAHDRVLPAWRDRAVAHEGDRVASTVAVEWIGSRDTMALRRAGPALILVFRSTCPACQRNAAAWRRLIAGRLPAVSVLAVGLEDRTSAAAYAGAQLKGTRVAIPLDEARFARLLALTAIPTTLLLDADGKIRSHRTGVLRPAQVDSLLRLTAVIGGRRSSASREPRGPATQLSFPGGHHATTASHLVRRPLTRAGGKRWRHRRARRGDDDRLHRLLRRKGGGALQRRRFMGVQLVHHRLPRRVRTRDTLEATHNPEPATTRVRPFHSERIEGGVR